MSEQPDRCTFCELVKGSAEVSVCYEDAESIAFMETQPVNTGHVLVVSREHYSSILDVPAEIAMRLFQVTMRLGSAIRRVTQCDDIDIVVNSGAAPGQNEPHHHVHIIPRRPGDGFSIDLPFGGSRMPDRTALDATAVQLIVAMREPTRSENLDDKTVEIPARELALMAAETGELPPRGGPGSAPIEREVVVQVAREGVSSGDPSRRGVWRLEEGAHGELIYDVRDTP